jgi:glycosyltransferase involved in cell wall biosynthesis
MADELHLLMPTYNREHMLERTLSGIFAQDANPASWHLTVVDNASTDGTRQLLEQCMTRWPNLDFVVNERNLGLFGNLNRCMTLARTEKYMILHSDDDVDATLVSSVLNFLDRYPKVQMCFGSCRARFDDTGEVIPNWYKSRIIGDTERVLGSGELASALVRSASNFIFAPTVVYDRSFFTSDLRYSTDYEFTSDLDLWFRVALKDPTVGFMPQPHITCGIHSGRLSHKHADSMRLEAVAVIRKYLAIIRSGPDTHIVNERLASFIEMKLRSYEFAIRHHLVPGFKLRRIIASMLELFAPPASRRGEMS